jgi:glycosyltransferase involved in cell wall biosynthesis
VARIAVVVGLNVHDTLPRVLAQLEGWEVIVVDDGSEPPLPGATHRHSSNRGYGAAQKTGYRAALDAGADRVVMVHGDGQYAVADCLALADALDDADIVLGSRFLAEDRGAVIPWWRRGANRALTRLGNRALGVSLTEMHTGARAYRGSALQAIPFGDFSDDYVFDQQLIATMARKGLRFAERPVQVSYDDTVQSISLRRSIQYGLGCLRVLAGSRVG